MQPIQQCYFILRLWQADPAKLNSWRASVENPETGKRIGFASLEQLFAFLMDFSERNCDPKTLDDFAVRDGSNQAPYHIISEIQAKED